MGKHSRAAAIGVVCLTGLALPWALSSPTDRVPLGADVVPRIDVPAVRLEFALPSPEPEVLQLPDDNGPTVKLSIDVAKIPAELPGADAAMAPLPRFDPADPKTYHDALAKLYPPLPPAGVAMLPDLGPDGRPMSLADLQRYAETHSPLIRLAAADVAPQAKSYCNCESIFLARQRHARALAAADRELAQLALAQIEAEVIAGVRRGYFAVLAAQESMRVQEAFAKFTDDSYRVQVDRVRTGQAGIATPLPLRALAYQSRAQLVLARNRYLSAWKQLTATIGRLELGPCLLDGRIDRPLPIMNFESVQACVMSRNAEVAIARNNLEAAQIELRHRTMMPLAFLHRDSIARARVELAKAELEPAIVRSVLSVQLADAFERYDSQRRILAYYRDNIIPDQARAYRAIASRPQQAADRTQSLELIAAQQVLAASVATYLQSLGDAWFAVVDLGRLMHSRDLFSDCGETCGSLATCLVELPSCRYGSAAMDWPEVMPSIDDFPAGSRPSVLEGSRTVPGVPSLPCALSPSVPGSVLVAPPSSVEKSTKRRKVFSWPTRRGEGDGPLMLPQTEELGVCCPPPNEGPKALPQPTIESAPPGRLPDGPLKQSSMPLPPLPQIIEGPVEKNDRGPRVDVPPARGIIPVVAVVEGGEPPLAARPPQPGRASVGEILYFTLPGEPRPPLAAPSPQPAGSIAGTSAGETLYFALPEAPPPPLEAIPALRVPSMKSR